MQDTAIAVPHIGSLQQLLPETLDTILSFLDHSALVQLHIATAASYEKIRHRVSATRCACHWLKLSKRLPPAINLPAADSHDWESASAASAMSSANDPSDSEDDLLLDDQPGEDELWESAPNDLNDSRPLASSRSSSSAEEQGGSPIAKSSSDWWSSGSFDLLGNFAPEGDDSAPNSPLDPRAKAKQERAARRARQRAYQRAEQQICWRPCSKHKLLEVLHNQIQHINDIAALMHHAVRCATFSWEFDIEVLGLVDKKSEWRLHASTQDSMNRFVHNIKQAFLIGYDNFVNFYKDTSSVRNVWRDFIAFHDSQVLHSLEFSDYLAFMCTLYRLQQMPSRAVLARFHSLLSRSSRCDLLLLSQVLLMNGRNHYYKEEYMACLTEIPATDLLGAFAQSEPAVRDVVSSLTESQRDSMLLRVKETVDRFVARTTKYKHRWYAAL